MNFSNIKDWTIPQGSVTRVTDSHGIVIWEKSGGHDYSQDYFFVEDVSGQSNTVSIKKYVSGAPTITVYKSTDGTNWERMGNTSVRAITATIPANSKLYLKATANSWCSNNYYNNITASGNCNVGGNIMSLLYGDNFKNQIEFPSGSNNNFHDLFYNNAKLVSAKNLILPATTLVNECYSQMFLGCTALTTAPALPATTLADSCYKSMFRDCTSLATAPALPATTLVDSCYAVMFHGCTSLATAPALPATTLVDSCYAVMFYRCTALTTAPELPATTLARNCYGCMFQGCSNLNRIVTYAQDISASNCINDWLYNVSATGDFYNLGGATYPSGASGIPTGWTEHNSL